VICLLRLVYALIFCTNNAFVFQIRWARLLRTAMDVKAAIRQSLVVKLFPCTDLVKQVTKISTNTKPAPRTRARQVVVARISVHTRVINTRGLTESSKIFLTLSYFLAVCVNVSSMDKQNVRTLINLLLLNETMWKLSLSQTQLCIPSFLQVLPFTLSVKGALYIRDTYSGMEQTL